MWTIISRWTLAALALAALCLAPAPAATAATTIKFASLAPEGTTWMNVMHALDRDVRAATGGEVRFRIYPGGVAGNEKDVVRKLRAGQLHAAGFTGVGLGDILPAVRLFELPFFFRNHDEVDALHKELDPWFDRAFRRNGYVLMGWSEVGFAHFFSKEPIRSLQDLRRYKVWMWEGDPLAQAYFDALGVRPIPLNVTDVLTSLQTGLIDTVYIHPLGAVALQWFTKVNYMSPMPMANVTGAIVVKKEVFDRLSPANQRILLDKAVVHMAELQKLTRAENRRAVEAMLKRGLKMGPELTPDDLAKIRRLARHARDKLAGTLIPAELIQRAEKTLAALRGAAGG